MPFLYASNGTIVWHLDTRPAKRVSRPISDFHTPEALAARFNDDPQPAHDWLRATPPEQIERLRFYQRGCILALEGAITGGKRDLMVAMATGKLSIDSDDLDLQPVFADRGGLRQLRKLFGADISALIEEFNLNIAA